MPRVFATAVGLASMLISVEAHAQQATSGVQGFYGGAANSTFDAVDFPNGDRNHLFSSGIPFSASASGSHGGASAGLEISASPQFGNVGLHGAGTATATDPTHLGTHADAGFDLYAYDTFHIGGESGSQQEFQYTLTLDGHASASSAPDTNAYGYYQLFADSNWVTFGTVSPFVNCTAYGPGEAFEANGNPCGMIAGLVLATDNPSTQGLQTLTGTITFMGDTTIQLGQLLDARIFAGTEYSDSTSAAFNASDTGWLTLTPITPGASFTTDSGLTYANSPENSAVPEPGTWAMMLLGFGAISVSVRRPKRRQRDYAGSDAEAVADSVDSPSPHFRS